MSQNDPIIARDTPQSFAYNMLETLLPVQPFLEAQQICEEYH